MDEFEELYESRRDKGPLATELTVETLGMFWIVWYFISCIQRPKEFHFIDYCNIVIHEAGHLIFLGANDFVHIAMGSGMQVLVPLLFVGYFAYLRQPLSSAICIMWAGESITNVSLFAADAILMQQPLMRAEGNVHDWNYIFLNLGVLDRTAEIAHGIYAIGVSILCIGIGITIVTLLGRYASFSSPKQTR